MDDHAVQHPGVGATHRHTRRGVVGAAVAGAIFTGLPTTALHAAALQTCSLGCTTSVCGEIPPGCAIFPPDNVWNTPIDHLPVDARSDAYVTSIGLDTGLHADFGSGLWEGFPIGIPFVRVPADQPPEEIAFEVADESDAGPYPIPLAAPIEGGSCGTGDRRVIVVQEGTCQLFEIFDATPQADGSWSAYSGARFDLTSHAFRPADWTSADAAGLPILAGLVRYQEIAAGVIPHALRFTASLTRDGWVWPACHRAGATDDSDVPAMGQRFRLRVNTDISAFSPTNRIILQGLKTYGMMLADNGSDWYLSGVPDERWDNDDLRQLRDGIRGSDFEAVDCTSLMLDPDSGQGA